MIAMNHTLEWTDDTLLREVERRSGAPVSACLQCHKCSSGCPVAPDMDLLPSQIMRLIHLGARDEVLESEAIWACASCEACTARCPMGIDVAAVMDALRMTAVEAQGGVGRPARQFFQQGLADQRALARPGVRTGHDGPVQARLSRPVRRHGQDAQDAGEAEALLPAALLAGREGGARGVQTSGRGGKETVRYAFFPGCSLESTAWDYDRSTRAVCGALDVELTDIPDWVCCGSTPAHASNASLAVALPVLNLQKAQAAGFSDVLTACASCYARLRTANHKVRKDPGEGERVRADHREALRRDRKGAPHPGRPRERRGRQRRSGIGFGRPWRVCGSPPTTAAFFPVRRRSWPLTMPNTPRAWTNW